MRIRHKPSQQASLVNEQVGAVAVSDHALLVHGICVSAAKPVCLRQCLANSVDVLAHWAGPCHEMLLGDMIRHMMHGDYAARFDGTAAGQAHPAHS